MNRPAAESPDVEQQTADATAVHRPRSRARFELILTGIWLAVGLFVLPAIIFAVGGALLGAYGDDGGLGRFYGDFFGDLAEPSVRAWIIALGPLVIISLLRLVFAGAGADRPVETPRQADHPAPSRRGPDEARRVEPRVGVE